MPWARFAAASEAMLREDAVEGGDAVARQAVVIVHRCRRVLKIKWLLVDHLRWVPHRQHDEQDRVLHLL